MDCAICSNPTWRCPQKSRWRHKYDKCWDSKYAPKSEQTSTLRLRKSSDSIFNVLIVIRLILHVYYDTTINADQIIRQAYILRNLIGGWEELAN